MEKQIMQISAPNGDVLELNYKEDEDCLCCHVMGNEYKLPFGYYQNNDYQAKHVFDWLCKNVLTDADADSDAIKFRIDWCREGKVLDTQTYLELPIIKMYLAQGTFICEKDARDEDEEGEEGEGEGEESEEEDADSEADEEGADEDDDEEDKDEEDDDEADEDAFTIDDDENALLKTMHLKCD